MGLRGVFSTVISQRLVQPFYLAVPGWRCNLFLAKQAARNIILIFEMENPRLEAKNSPFRSKSW